MWLSVNPASASGPSRRCGSTSLISGISLKRSRGKDPAFPVTSGHMFVLRASRRLIPAPDACAVLSLRYSGPMSSTLLIAGQYSCHAIASKDSTFIPDKDHARHVGVEMVVQLIRRNGLFANTLALSLGDARYLTAQREML